MALLALSKEEPAMPANIPVMHEAATHNATLGTLCIRGAEAETVLSWPWTQDCGVH